MNKLGIKIKNIKTQISNNYKEIQIYIDGKNLKDILKEIERPFATKEGNPGIEGQYIGLDAEYTYMSHFLREQSAKIALLDCSCGCSGCWTLIANIKINEKLIVWENFEQIHRNMDKLKWDYDNLFFEFDKEQYIKELEKIGN